MPVMSDQKVLKKECIQLWRLGTKQRTITSAGLSMHPFIIEGSTLTFVPSTADRSISLGDIALFERRDMLVVHRIVGHFYQDGSLCFREKGDNTFLPGSFPADSLIGRIVKIEYKGKVRDLTNLRSRFAGRMIGQYWSVFFTLLQGLIALKHLIFKDTETPRLRSSVLNVVRFLNRLPRRFTKR